MTNSRLHVRPHRHEVLDRDGAAGERRGAVVVGQVGDVDVEVRADHAPRRLVILERELAAERAQVLQRRRHPLRARRLAVVVVEAREVVGAVPLLDQHLPVGHLDRADRDVGVPAEGRHPVERDRDLLGGEEGPIAGMQAVDRQVLDEDLAGEQADPQRADVQRPLDVLGAGVLGPGADDRAEIDRDRRHDRRRQQRHDDREAEADVAEDRMTAEALEHVH